MIDKSLLPPPGFFAPSFNCSALSVAERLLPHVIAASRIRGKEPQALAVQPRPATT